MMAARLQQKARTRQALVEGTARLLDSGVADPSMEDIADESQVSRATAYRYFESASDVVWAAVSDRTMLDLGESMNAAGDDVVARVLAAEESVNGYVFSDPDRTRAFERGALDRKLRGADAADADRPGRRLRFIDAALEPIANQLSPTDLGDVRHALALAMGSQTVAAMLDTCRLDVHEARSVTRFACRAIAVEAIRIAHEGGVD